MKTKNFVKCSFIWAPPPSIAFLLLKGSKFLQHCHFKSVPVLQAYSCLCPLAACRLTFSDYAIASAGTKYLAAALSLCVPRKSTDAVASTSYNFPHKKILTPWLYFILSWIDSPTGYSHQYSFFNIDFQYIPMDYCLHKFFFCW